MDFFSIDSEEIARYENLKKIDKTCLLVMVD
jgi:hypothetical protein